MLGFVSMTAVPAVDYAAAPALVQSSAVSDAAGWVQRLLGNVARGNESVQSLVGREVEFQARLHAVLDELVTDEDQDPVTAAAVRIASRFVHVLPHSLPLPQVAIDPDGAISLDWMPSRTRAFSISVDDSGRLAFAWMNGSDRGHGVVRFQDSIPAPLFSQLTDLIDDDRAAVRAA
jgi:hypothetical protein